MFVVAPIAALLLLLLLGGLLLVAVLIANKNTRPLGLGLAGAGVLVVLALSTLSWIQVRHQTHQAARAHHDAFEAIQQTRISAAVAELEGELHKLDAQDEAARALIQDEIGRLQAKIEASRPTVVHAHASSGAERVSIAWGGIILVMVAVFVLLAFLTAVNRQMSKSAGVLTLLISSGLLALVVPYFMLRASYVESAQVSPPAAPNVSLDAAWDVTTTPKIELKSEAVSSGDTLAEASATSVATTEETAEEVESEPAAYIADEERTAEANAATDAIESDSQSADSAAEPESTAADEEAPTASIEAPAAEAVAVESSATIAPTRTEAPLWVTNPPKRIGHVYERVVSTDPCLTEDECYAKLRDALMQATAEFIEVEIAGREVSTAEVREMGLTPGYLRANLCTDFYTESVDTESFNDLKRIYALVQYNDTAREDLQHRWDALARRSALAGVAATGGGVLGLVGLVFGLLKLDEATRGYYTKRLFIGVPAAIISVLALVAFALAL